MRWDGMRAPSVCWADLLSCELSWAVDVLTDTALTVALPHSRPLYPPLYVCSSRLSHPANTRRWINVVVLLGQRRRRWTNTAATFIQGLVGTRRSLFCKRQYLITCEVSRYCLLAPHDSATVSVGPGILRPHHRPRINRQMVRISRRHSCPSRPSNKYSVYHLNTQRQTAVTAYLKSKQLLLIDFAHHKQINGSLKSSVFMLA